MLEVAGWLALSFSCMVAIVFLAVYTVKRIRREGLY